MRSHTIENESTLRKKCKTLCVSAIVVNYNSGITLREAIDALINCCVSQIIVVDNASSDGSLHILREENYKGRVTIIENKRNLGFSAANNIGIKLADRDKLLFINPDCKLSFEALQRMLGVISGEKHIGAVSCKILNLRGEEQRGSRRTFPTPFTALNDTVNTFFNSPKMLRSFNLKEEDGTRAPYDVDAISGGCMLVERQALMDVGAWDEGYFLHCEDIDLCMRLKMKKWRVVFVPDVHAVHEGGIKVT